MGFDLSGMNPNLTRPQPELPPFPERTDKDWEKLLGRAIAKKK